MGTNTLLQLLRLLYYLLIGRCARALTHKLIAVGSLALGICLPPMLLRRRYCLQTQACRIIIPIIICSIIAFILTMSEGSMVRQRALLHITRGALHQRPDDLTKLGVEIPCRIILKLLQQTPKPYSDYQSACLDSDTLHVQVSATTRLWSVSSARPWSEGLRRIAARMPMRTCPK